MCYKELHKYMFDLVAIYVRVGFKRDLNTIEILKVYFRRRWFHRFIIIIQPSIAFHAASFFHTFFQQATRLFLTPSVK